MESKTCMHCRVSRPLSDYGKNSRRKDGLNYYCKPCANARAREYKARTKNERPLRAIWEGMIGRCTNPNNKDYPRYGARGITVCPRWLASYEAFHHDMMPRPDGASLDRIDNNGPYSPENTKWSTPSEQAYNRRDNRLISYQGETLPLGQWAARLGINRITLRGRLARMSVDEAFSRPPQPRRKLTFNGETRELADWAKVTGISRDVLYARIYTLGWTTERALTEPISNSRRSP